MAEQSKSLRPGSGSSEDSAGSLRSGKDGGSNEGSLRSLPTRSSEGQGSGDKGSSSSKLSEVERAQAIAELRYYAAGHREAIGAMLDGVVLGAEQVQDKRLELLETGPEDSFLSSPIVSIALTLVLEGSLGPLIASFIARRIMGRIFVAVASGINFSRRSELLKKELRLFQEEFKNLQQEVQTKGLPKGTRYGEWRDFARQLQSDANRLQASSEKLSFGDARKAVTAWRDLTSELPVNLVAGAKVGREQLLRSPEATPSPDSTAGVSILGAAMEEAAAMRLIVAAAEESSVVALSQSDISLSEVRTILENFRPQSFELGVIRDSFALLSEGMTWAKHLDLSAPIDSKSQSVTLTSAVKRSGLDNGRLGKYLNARFGKIAREWLKGATVVDGREQWDPGPASAGTPLARSVPPSGRLSAMEGGGFAGGPRDSPKPKTSEERLRDELEENNAMLVQLYLSAIGGRSKILEARD